MIYCSEIKVALERSLALEALAQEGDYEFDAWDIAMQDVFDWLCIQVDEQQWSRPERGYVRDLSTHLPSFMRFHESLFERSLIERCRSVFDGRVHIRRVYHYAASAGFPTDVAGVQVEVERCDGSVRFHDLIDLFDDILQGKIIDSE